jgi:hypothetical protein
MEPRRVKCFDTPEAQHPGCVSDADLGPRACEAIPTLGVPADLRAQGSEMPVTLARLLVLVFALSYGRGLLRDLNAAIPGKLGLRRDRIHSHHL